MRTVLVAALLAVRSVVPGVPSPVAPDPVLLHPGRDITLKESRVAAWLENHPSPLRRMRRIERQRERERLRERLRRRAHARAARKRHHALVRIHNLLAIAKSKLGTPYVFGGSGPYSFDCSGFVRWLFARFHVYLPHSARSQAVVVQRVSASDMRPGDLIFYSYGRLGYAIDHVEVYMGEGRQIGTSNPTEDLDIDPIDWDSVVAIGRPKGFIA